MKERECYLDNAKFILIFLVVLGHYCGSYLNSHILLGFYDAIYSFHMPAFILLSGYLSKNIKQQRYKDIDTILLPYIIIQVIYILYRNLLGMHQDWTFVIPIDANWYLLGMFLWRLVIPYFNYFRYPVITSVVISLAVGFMKDFGDYLDLERIITFFPYFVIGYFLPENFKDRVLQFKPKIFPYLLFGLIMTTLVLFADLFPGQGSFVKRCFIPSGGYDIRFGRYAEIGVFIRALSYLFSLVITFLFFILVPNRKTWYTEPGSRTIHVFLFHLLLLNDI
jgi:fucose 4-O-acetylase-like acetyltransferase